jgi:hypothetical protein
VLLAILYTVGKFGQLPSEMMYGMFTSWCITGILAATGVICLASCREAAVLMHAAGAISLNGIAVSVYMDWLFLLQHACQQRQSSMLGCDTCTCAQEDSCGINPSVAVDLDCQSCFSLPVYQCTWLIHKDGWFYVLLCSIAAIMWILASVLISLEIALIINWTYSTAKKIGMEAAISLLVDQQTRILAAGDKPTVTPGTLRSWVSQLLLSDSPQCHSSAVLCQLTLNRRGYSLKPIENPDELWSAERSLTNNLTMTIAQNNEQNNPLTSV